MFIGSQNQRILCAIALYAKEGMNIDTTEISTGKKITFFKKKKRENRNLINLDFGYTGASNNSE